MNNTDMFEQRAKPSQKGSAVRASSTDMGCAAGSRRPLAQSKWQVATRKYGPSGQPRTTPTGAANINTTMTLWTHQDNYMSEDYSDYYVVLARTRDSDALERTNFAAAEARLGGKCIKVCCGHWACGWVEWLGVHVDDADAVAIAREIEAALERYPVLDEDAYCAAQQEEDDESWEFNFCDRTRLRHLREHGHHASTWIDLRRCVRGEVCLTDYSA